MKLMIALVALIAIAVPAHADGTAHIEATANGETHTVDLVFADDGTATLLVDGQPVSTPAAPGLPATPELPATPALPSAPDVPVPSAPATPELPTVSTTPLPTLPIPALP